MSDFEKIFKKWEKENKIIDKDSNKKELFAKKNINKKKKNNISKIDLHGMKKSEALHYLESFIWNNINNKGKIIIIHGIGKHSKDKRVLKEAVIEWLKNNSLIRFFRPGMPEEGGSGVTIAYLK